MQTVLKKPSSPTLLGKSSTSPIDQRKRKEVKVHVRKKVAIFYIGGAGDKRKFVPLPEFIAGPFRNILDAKSQVDLRTIEIRKKKLLVDFWRGYYEIFGEKNIEKNIIQYIPDISVPIIIIGHSLGGWNGAHLSSILSKKGYSVEMLVTLDPVGQGNIVSATSDIYNEVPTPIANYWINILANPKADNFSDFIADFGEQWNIKSGPQINSTVDVNHADAGIMFRLPISEKKSALDLVHKKILELTK